MGDVIDLIRPSQYLTGWAKCLACNHEWIAVSIMPLPTALECPQCSTNRGVFEDHPVDDEVLACDCGSIHFAVNMEWEPICLLCGKYHSWSDDA